MYLVTSHIPVYTSDHGLLMQQDWHASLTNFSSHFGPEFNEIVVLAPQELLRSRPAAGRFDG